MLQGKTGKSLIITSCSDRGLDNVDLTHNDLQIAGRPLWL